MTGLFWIGLDLGQATDYTAICVIEQLGSTLEGDDKPVYHLRHIERPQLGTPYPRIVARLCELVTTPEINDRYLIVADATGVGAPVVDLLHEASLAVAPVTITGGDAPVCIDGHWRVPKRDLVFALLAALQTDRLKVAAGLDLGPLLVNELLNFKVKISAAGHDSYAAWREGVHDDLVLSAALAVWHAERVGAATIRFIA